jgi:hypothetical protein
VVQALGVLAGTGNPTSDSCFRELKDTRGGVSAETFGDGVQDLGNAGLRGFEAVKGGVPAGGELSAAGLTIEILDRLTAPVMTVTDQGMERGIGDLEVEAVGVGTGEAIGVECFLAAAGTFLVGIGTTVRSEAVTGLGPP